MDQNKKQEINNWYIGVRPIYKKLSIKVESIITELLEENNINVHNVYSRAKDIDSFSSKVSKKGYTNPEKDIHDLAGIRVISYVESDLEIISNIIKETFKIDEKNSIDKKKELGIDKVGYQSVHFVAELKSDRISLPEYRKFKNLKFEIQIRTILQHAWAEIEHDRNYKFSGQLPEEIKRRFTVLAGALELADREFNSIAHAIDEISEEVSKATKSGELDIPINSTTLNSYLNDKLENLIKKGAIKNSQPLVDELEEIETLHKFKINTLSELDALMTPDYIENYEKLIPKSKSTYQIFISNLLLAKFNTTFFDKIDSSFYSIIFEHEIQLQKAMGTPIEKIIEKYKIPRLK
jgi:ppGpp synthetase/RelA/SpoT-type nucleotidyltranferase